MSVEDVYKMSSSELTGWQEYFSIYPTMGERLDWIINLLAIDIVKGTKAKPQDFLPEYLHPKEKSLEQQRAEALAFAMRYKSVRGK